MRLRPLWLSIIFFALAGCGGNDDVELPVQPQLFVDRDSLGFGQEFGSGAYVGTQVYESLYIENRGQETLEITQVSLAAPAEFIVSLPEPLPQGQPLRLESRAFTAIQIAFKPTQAREYTGTLTIKSNAANAANKDIALSGRGISR
jgi:hypothetical protein